ncbi:FtsX-like permease family protein [Salisediminibacterium selenitireducens]|uniref:Putative hemin transport system permease protein HrtB n=1 Tax=Bacillus selenitireducens (strain ATCC 700615 / DSM 15326 / MLS10) TaxID=439292 RepID=D6XWE5_BACIE|nr:FtsX-like permease family protein [Salisediminibacterium selenitireducens]ADH97787.1 protein of unknown function DUF214 [[Bacillus] selenitireducens MLS10]
MGLAFKEIKRSKMKFTILGSIIFLISFLTFIISGLANGLAYDNVSLIKDLPDGTYYMTEEADGNAAMSEIGEDLEASVLADHDGAFTMATQNGALRDEDDVRHNVVFASSSDEERFGALEEGDVLLDESMKEDVQAGDSLTVDQLDLTLTVAGFLDETKYNHAAVAWVKRADYETITRSEAMQFLLIPGDDAPTISGLDRFTADEFLNAIPSYSAEQLSLTMIVWFLVAISGLLFAIFFYMMNVQKIGLYGILKAIGVKTSTLFGMMWLQMLIITLLSLTAAALLSQLFQFAVEGLPFLLAVDQILELSVIFLVIGFLGATASGIQIRYIQPLQAIQQGEMA